jgi:dephospho-CoA kinase
MIIGLSGYAQSGKDSTAELLCLNYGYTRVAFADPMRQALMTINPRLDSITRVSDMVEDYGWDTTKRNPEVRRLLQVLGTDFGRKMLGDDVWINIALSGIKSEDKIVISDVRYPNEADAIRKLGGIVWRINRRNHSAVNAHASEHAMDNYMFNYVIYNDGTLDDLSEEVFMLAKELNLSS